MDPVLLFRDSRCCRFEGVLLGGLGCHYEVLISPPLLGGAARLGTLLIVRPDVLASGVELD